MEMDALLSGLVDDSLDDAFEQRTSRRICMKMDSLRDVYLDDILNIKR